MSSCLLSLMNTTTGILERVARCAGTALAAAQGVRESVHEIVTSNKRKYDEMLDPENMYYYDLQTTGAPDILGEGSEPDEELDEEVERPLVCRCRFCSLYFEDEEAKLKHEKSECASNAELWDQVEVVSANTTQEPGQTDQEHMRHCIHLMQQRADENATEAPVAVHDVTGEVKTPVHLAIPVDVGPIHSEEGCELSDEEVRHFIHERSPEAVCELNDRQLDQLVAFDDELGNIYKTHGGTERRCGFFTSKSGLLKFCLTMLRQREENNRRMKRPSPCPIIPDDEATEQDAGQKALESLQNHKRHKP